MKQNIASKAKALVEEAVVSAGFTLWDVRYEKQAEDWTLTFELDRGENMSMSDCEEANNIIEPIIDAADPIENAYVLEVSSAGLSRTVRTEEHYKKCIENKWNVELKLFKATEGKKEFNGVITAYNENEITLEDQTVIEIKNIAKATAILG